MPLAQSLPAQVSITVPTPPAPVINMIVTLPEAQNPFYVAMAQLLPYYVYASSANFTVLQIKSVAVNGTGTPGAAITILVNNVSQSAPGSIIADHNGNWSTTVVLGQGQSIIQAQYST